MLSEVQKAERKRGELGSDRAETRGHPWDPFCLRRVFLHGGTDLRLHERPDH